MRTRWYNKVEEKSTVLYLPRYVWEERGNGRVIIFFFNISYRMVWENSVPISLNVAALRVFIPGRTGSVGARCASKITLKSSHLASGRSIDETIRNFFCRSHKHRRFSRYNEGRGRKGEGEAGRNRYFNAWLWYDNVPVHGIMYIGSYMIIWRDKAALSRHKLNRFSPLSVSLPRPSLPISFSTHPLPLWSSEETPTEERDALAYSMLHVQGDLLLSFHIWAHECLLNSLLQLDIQIYSLGLQSTINSTWVAIQKIGITCRQSNFYLNSIWR